MNEFSPSSVRQSQLPGLSELKVARSLLDQLLTDSKLYTQSKDYMELLDFVVRLRIFAPFNAMLLQVQKPGLSYAASAADWGMRFSRTIKAGARPLLILWPFGPVALVYDVLDTEGKELPKDVETFFAHGAVDELLLTKCRCLLQKSGIEWVYVDAGDKSAGSIRLIKRAEKIKGRSLYSIHINENHSIATQFTTLAHELGHLYLGHLGSDKWLGVPERKGMTHAQVELEAESVAYLVCKRNGVESKSETYLSNFVKNNTTIAQLDIFQILRAAGHVEALLGLTSPHQIRDEPVASNLQEELLKLRLIP